MAAGPCDGFTCQGGRSGFEHVLSMLLQRIMDELADPRILFWVTENVKELGHLLGGHPAALKYVTRRLEEMVRRR